MRIITKTKNLDTALDLEKLVEDKIKSIKKFINILKEDEAEGKKTLAEIFVELEKETNHHKKGKIFLAKAKIVLPGKTIIAAAKAEDLFRAITCIKEELKTEIEKYKFKKVDKNRRERRKSKMKMEI